MPLPLALQKKLKNRGIIEGGSTIGKVRATNHLEIHEEIIAEDYDDNNDLQNFEYNPRKKRDEFNSWSDRLKKRIIDSSNGYKSCKNKYNIYHKCTTYCITRWTDGCKEPKPSVKRRYERLTKIYPLSRDWREMYDCAFGIFYFYSLNEDVVSWLPPQHPKAVITKSAGILRKENDDLLQMNNITDDYDIQSLSNKQQQTVENTPIMTINPHQHQLQQQQQQYQQLKHHHMLQNQPQQYTNVTNNYKRQNSNSDIKTVKKINPYYKNDKKNLKKNLLLSEKVDPMDPSSYSNVPLGNWSSGLDNKTSEDLVTTGDISTIINGSQIAGGNKHNKKKFYPNNIIVKLVNPNQ